MAAEEFDRREISFAQAEGYAELPRQLALKELPQIVKARLWYVVDTQITKYTGEYSYLRDPMQRFARAHWVEVEGRFSDEFKPDAVAVKKNWKKYFIESATYVDTLGFVQWFIRRYHDEDVEKYFSAVLIRERAAYRINDKTIVPMASPEEGQAIVTALTTLDTVEAQGSRKHLADAASDLTSGNYADSVRNSIHAIESLVRKKTGKHKFGEAVNDLHKTAPLHGSLREALLKLYGYSSDQQGIRHPLLDSGDANVSEADALFMIGVCASFATYLMATT